MTLPRGASRDSVPMDTNRSAKRRSENDFVYITSELRSLGGECCGVFIVRRAKYYHFFPCYLLLC